MTLRRRIPQGELDALASAGGSGGRILLTEHTTYYVDATSGSDTTGDGTELNPWASPQKAYDHVVENVDCAGFDVTIQHADGTYNCDPTSACVLFANGTPPNGLIYLRGNITDPQAVRYKATTNQQSIYLYTYAPFSIYVNGISFEGTSSTSWGIYIAQPANLYLGSGPASTNYEGYYDPLNKIYAIGRFRSFISAYGFGTYVYIDTEGIEVSPSGNWSNFIFCEFAYIYFYATAVTLDSALTGSTFFYCRQGRMYIDVTTWTGTFTGKKYDSIQNGIIDDARNNLPGTVAGTTATQGQYI